MTQLEHHAVGFTFSFSCGRRRPEPGAAITVTAVTVAWIACPWGLEHVTQAQQL